MQKYRLLTAMSNQEYKREIEVTGHLIDSMILTRIFDRIMDLEGEFEVIQFTIGKEKSDKSYVKLWVKANTPEHLREILEEVYNAGATPIEITSAYLNKAPRDMVLPADFYSTTNNLTSVLLNGDWIEVEDQMMDKAIVVDLKRRLATCKPIRAIRAGDEVVVGDSGIRISPPERPREGMNVFQFMSSYTSTEKPVQAIAKRIAEDVFGIKKRKGKMAVVAGPAIVHTGATESLAYLIRSGYVSVLLAGNALLVHDIEYSLFGTSLGVDVQSGSSKYQGHRHHMVAVNELFKAGSVESLVKTNALRSGILYECVKSEIPYVLAGSIRDDGPAPGVITDVVEAQQKYKEALKGLDLVIMLSTMLHSIAVGNMLPSQVKVVAVDINPSTLTKLLDRGTGQAVGVVSDVGSFLPLVVKDLKDLESNDIA